MVVLILLVRKTAGSGEARESATRASIKNFIRVKESIIYKGVVSPMGQTKEPDGKQ